MQPSLGLQTNVTFQKWINQITKQNIKRRINQTIRGKHNEAQGIKMKDFIFR